MNQDFEQMKATQRYQDHKRAVLGAGIGALGGLAAAGPFSGGPSMVPPAPPSDYNLSIAIDRLRSSALEARDLTGLLDQITARLHGNRPEKVGDPTEPGWPDSLLDQFAFCQSQLDDRLRIIRLRLNDLCRDLGVER